MLALLLEEATDHSVEVAIGFLKECGSKLSYLAPRALQGVFDTLRIILHEGKIDKRVQYMMEVLAAVRKAKFAVSSLCAVQTIVTVVIIVVW